MDASHWDLSTWRDLIESGGVIASLLLAAYTNRREEKARKIGNLIAMTQLHNDLWQKPENNPQLSRILDRQANIDESPVTGRETQFVKRLIVHVSTVYRAKKEGVFTEID